MNPYVAVGQTIQAVPMTPERQAELAQQQARMDRQMVLATTIPSALFGVTLAWATGSSKLAGAATGAFGALFALAFIRGMSV